MCHTPYAIGIRDKIEPLEKLFLLLRGKQGYAASGNGSPQFLQKVLNDVPFHKPLRTNDKLVVSVEAIASTAFMVS